MTPQELVTHLQELGYDVQPIQDSPETLICDFCSAPDPPYYYNAADFQFTKLDWASRGAWVACHDCRDLIERDDWDTLHQRTIDSHHSSSQEELEAVKLMATLAHAGFRAHRWGSVQIRCHYHVRATSTGSAITTFAR